MSTQGILISSDSNQKVDQNEMNSRSRSVSAATSLSLPLSIVDQENRNRNITKTPGGKVLKPQIISPRLLVTHKKATDPLLLSSNGKNSHDNHSLTKSGNYVATTKTSTPSPKSIRKGSVTNSTSGLSILGHHGHHGHHGHSSKEGSKNHLSNSNPVLLSNSASHTTNISSLISTNEKPVYRSTSSHTQTSQQKINFKRFTTNPKSSPAVKHDSRKLQSPPQFIPIFPPAPLKPEKFVGGSDKIAYKIWMKQRAKYEKWESSKALFDAKFAEGSIRECQKILARLDAELEELNKGIREDECRRLFPEEPPKPAEYCPPTVKEAKQWYQQKVMYEAWQNAFILFQENSAKGDVSACKKLVDIIQMTLYNPSFKPELAITLQPLQPQSGRRSTIETAGKSISSPDIDPYISKPQNVNVKFAPDGLITTNGGTPHGASSNPALPHMSKTRPKLKPPASWTKNKPKSEEKIVPEKLIDKGAHVAFIEVDGPLKDVRLTYDGDDQILLHALDLELADLKSSLDNYFTLENQN